MTDHPVSASDDPDAPLASRPFLISSFGRLRVCSRRESDGKLTMHRELEHNVHRTVWNIPCFRIVLFFPAACDGIFRRSPPNPCCKITNQARKFAVFDIDERFAIESTFANAKTHESKWPCLHGRGNVRNSAGRQRIFCGGRQKPPHVSMQRQDGYSFFLRPPWGVHRDGSPYPRVTMISCA